jgi:hypothetical protein
VDPFENRDKRSFLGLAIHSILSDDPVLTNGISLGQGSLAGYSLTAEEEANAGCVDKA